MRYGAITQTALRTIAMFLVMVIIAPSFALSVAPKQVGAVSAGTVVASSAAGATSCLATAYIGKFMNMAKSIVKNIKGIKDAAGALGNTDKVPVADDNVAKNTKDTAQAAQSTAKSTAEASGHTYAQIVKECVLDVLAWAIKDMIIRQMMRDVIVWANDGFEGSPAFIQDTGRWFKDLGDNFLHDILDDTGFTDLMCEPFRVSLKIQLYLGNIPDYSPQGRKKCTLSEFMDNATYDAVVKGGDFNAAGISGMLGLQQETNNEVGSYFAAQEEISKRIQENVIAPASNMLAYGDGYLAMKCDMNGNSKDGNEATCTPGDFIKEQLNENAKGPLKELIAADEFSEMINALIAGFIKTVLNGEGGKGLLGASSNSSYWDSAQSAQPSTDEWTNHFNEQFPGLFEDVTIDDVFGTSTDEATTTATTTTSSTATSSSSTAMTQAQIDALDVWKTDLNSISTTLTQAVSQSYGSTYMRYYPRLLTINTDLTSVDTAQRAAYTDLADIQNRLRDIARSLRADIRFPTPITPPTT